MALTVSATRVKLKAQGPGLARRVISCGPRELKKKSKAKIDAEDGTVNKGTYLKGETDVTVSAKKE